MGNFYVNFSVKTPDPQRVAAALDGAGRRAIVTPPQGGYVVAYDEAADTQAVEPILAAGRLLSRAAGGPVLGVLNHDDDILCYWLFEGGEVTDEYNSTPDYFAEDDGEDREQGGDAARLCAALRPDAAAAAVDAVLRGEYVFAVERHERLADALGLPPWSLGLGYRYVADGELGDDVDPGLLTRTGGGSG